MSDLADAAAALGVSEAIVMRSADARAKATGTSVDEVLKAWASGAAAPAAATPPVTSPQQPASSPQETPDAGRQTPAEPEPAPTAPAGDRRPETGDKPLVTAPSVASAPPSPKEVSPKEALRYPVVVTVATSGLKERTVASVPKWLASLFVIIPMFGLIQLTEATSNDCGQGAELATDRVSGALINCDGTPFEGRGEIGGGVDFIALGEEVFRGQVVAAANCQGCHGAQGQGGQGPPLGPVLSTFSSCVDHIEWVSKGTAGFQAEGRATYGDLNKPVGAVGTMPPFVTQLSPEQIAAAVAFERVRFGGQAPEQALGDCGLVEPAPDEAATEGSTGEGSTGEGSTGTTATGETSSEEGGPTTTPEPATTAP